MKLSCRMRFVLLVIVCFLLVIFVTLDTETLRSNSAGDVKTDASVHESIPRNNISTLNRQKNQSEVFQDGQKLHSCLTMGRSGRPLCKLRSNHEMAVAMFQDSYDRDILNKWYTAVLERFEAGRAVILLAALNQKMVVPKQDLPDEADVNTWLTIWIDKKGHAFLFIDDERTKQERRRAEQLRDLMRNAPRRQG